MKKFFKNLSKVLCAILVVTFASVAIACGSTNSRMGSVTTPVDQTSTEATGNETQEVSNNQNDEATKIDLNGIYTFDKAEYNFTDIYYEDENALFDDFNSVDLNGVHEIARQRGFYDIVKELGSNASHVLYFDGDESTGTVYSMYYGDNNMFNMGDFSFTYLIDENNAITTSLEDLLIIETTENGLTVYWQFYYFNEDDQPVYTSLYVKTTLSLVANSKDILNNSNSYTYSADTFSMTSTSLADINPSNQLLAQMFNIDTETTENVYVEVVNQLSNWKLNFNEDYTRIIFYPNQDEEVLSIVMANGNSFNLNGVNVIFKSYETNGSLNVISFEIQLANSAVATFEFVR